jgi:hypothetical protein
MIGPAQEAVLPNTLHGVFAAVLALVFCLACGDSARTPEYSVIAGTALGSDGTCSPSDGSRALADGVQYYDCTGRKPGVHLITVSRKDANAQLKLLHNTANDRELQLTKLTTLAKDAGAIVAINGFEWHGDVGHNLVGVPTSGKGTPTTSVFAGSKRLSNDTTDRCQKCRNGDPAGCDPATANECDVFMLGFASAAGEIGARLFASQETDDPDNAAYLQAAYGSEWAILRDGTCNEQLTSEGYWTAVGYSDDALVFVAPSGGYRGKDLCQTLRNFGVSNAVRNDGASAAGLYFDGKNHQPQALPLGGERYIAYGLGIVAVPLDPGPDGSYTQTCRECGVKNDTLRCKACKDLAGDEQSTQLNLPCTTDIANCDGVLTCGGCGPAAPDGSYAQTCSHCKVVSDVLTCDSCIDVAGGSRRTALALPCDVDVANCDGILTCGGCPDPNPPDAPAPSALPEGSYSQTCSDCYVVNDVLACDACIDIAGNSRRAAVQLPCGGDVANCDGLLTCGGCPDPNAHDQPPPTASSTPSGSYALTCSSCYVVNDVLACDACVAIAGNARQSAIALPCDVDIANCDGSLTCGGCPDPNAHDQLSPAPSPPAAAPAAANPPVGAPPSGSFDQSCSGCRVVSGVLTCDECRTISGNLQSSALALPCAGDIANCDGALTCGGCPQPPDGSYAQTCTGCRVQDNVLSCDACRDTSDGAWFSTLLLPCGGDIANCNGSLTCGGCPVPPPGSYADSCSGCSVSADGSVLSCDACRDTGDGAWFSTLLLPCSGDIANCNGTLTCGGC